MNFIQFIKKHRNVLLFFTAVFFQAVVFVFLLLQTGFIKKSSVENNRIYTFECDFSDPFDFMKGHYLSLNIKQAQVKTSELDEETFAQLDLNKTRRIVYLVVEPDQNGIWNVKGIRKEKPSESCNFIKAKIKRTSYGDSQDKTVYLDFLFNDYYMQENLALYVDSLDNLDEKKPVLKLYSDKNGNCIQQGLYVLNDDNEYIRIEDFAVAMKKAELAQ